MSCLLSTHTGLEKDDDTRHSSALTESIFYCFHQENNQLAVDFSLSRFGEFCISFYATAEKNFLSIGLGFHKQSKTKLVVARFAVHSPAPSVSAISQQLLGYSTQGRIKAQAN